MHAGAAALGPDEEPAVRGAALFPNQGEEVVGEVGRDGVVLEQALRLAVVVEGGVEDVERGVVRLVLAVPVCFWEDGVWVGSLIS